MLINIITADSKIKVTTIEYKTQALRTSIEKNLETPLTTLLLKDLMEYEVVACIKVNRQKK